MLQIDSNNMLNKLNNMQVNFSETIYIIKTTTNKLMISSDLFCRLVFVLLKKVQIYMHTVFANVLQKLLFRQCYGILNIIKFISSVNKYRTYIFSRSLGAGYTLIDITLRTIAYAQFE